MSARRLDSRAILFGVALAFSLAATVEGQSRGTFAISPQPNRPRKGVEVKPAPVPTADPFFLPAQPVAFNLVPAILMSDGTVWANFGFGFEPVVRSCGSVVVTQPAVMAGNGALITQPAAPTYMQPAPVQKTASQQVIAASQNGATVQTSRVAQLSCFGRDASGRVFVLR